jgi:hypothetical protein
MLFILFVPKLCVIFESSRQPELRAVHSYNVAGFLHKVVDLKPEQVCDKELDRANRVPAGTGRV